MAVPPPAPRARPFRRRICSSSCRSLPAPRARPAAAKRVRISSQSLPARAGRAHSSAGYAPHRAIPSPRPGRVLRQPGVYGFHRVPLPRAGRVQSPAGYAPRAVPSRAPGAFCGSQVCTDFIAIPPRAFRARSYSVKSMDGRARCHTCRGAGAGREPGKIVRRGRTHWGRPAARCPSTEAHAPPIWKEPVCLLHSILRQGPQSTAIRPLRRRTKHPRRVKNPDQPHDSRPRSITPPRAAAKKSDQTPPCRHPSVDVSAHPSSWRGLSGGGRIARQAATIRAAALLTVSRPAGRFSRMAGAIAAAHAIWREGGAPRAGRTEFPPRNRAAAQTRGRRANSRNWGLQKRAARGRIAPFEF